jgi:serine protease inhibitor
MKKLSTLALTVALGLGVQASAADARTAARANNDFGVSLFKATALRTGNGNKFLSPTSAYLALAMAYNGTLGNTQAEMEKALALTGLTRDEANAANRDLVARLTQGRDFDLSIANSLWARDGFSLKDTFVDTVRANYGATLETLDFALPSASVTINDWVKAKTKNRIDSIVPDRLPADLRLLLINATYFEAKWQFPFSRWGSRNAPFTKASGAQVQVPTMHGSGYWKHHETSDYEAIELPYGQSGEAAMVVVVPKDLAAFESGLTGNEWDKIAIGLDAVTPALGTLALPSLELKYESSLVGALNQLGMRQAFQDGAEFGALTDDSVAISEVLQKTYLKVYEEGTIAAAVTGIGVSATSVPVFQYDMKVDRPYAFGIRDKRTGALLFFGTIQEPEGGRLPQTKP